MSTSLPHLSPGPGKASRNVCLGSIILDYLGRSKVIPRVLKSERERQKTSESMGHVSTEEWSEIFNVASFEDGGQKP